MTSKFAIALFAAFAATLSSAQAYIDPGAGSLILQGIVGAIAGGMFVARTYWHKITAFLLGRRRTPEPDGDFTRDRLPGASNEG